jgi:hypothetical protein
LVATGAIGSAATSGSPVNELGSGALSCTAGTGSMAAARRVENRPIMAFVLRIGREI